MDKIGHVKIWLYIQILQAGGVVLCCFISLNTEEGWAPASSTWRGGRIWGGGGHRVNEHSMENIGTFPLKPSNMFNELVEKKKKHLLWDKNKIYLLHVFVDS